MRIAIPIMERAGLDSPIRGHYGSAPYFAFVESTDQSIEVISNANLSHVHGDCNPIQALAGRQVDVVVVAGIGRKALIRLTDAGIRVYQSRATTLAEAIQTLQMGTLTEIGPDHTCHEHRHAGPCDCRHGQH